MVVDHGRKRPPDDPRARAAAGLASNESTGTATDMHQRRRVCTLTAVAVALAAPGVGADPHDHDRARAALERGEVRPVAEVLAAVAAAVPGDVVGVEMEHEHGRWLYELKLIAPDGHVLEVMVDAATATVLGREHE